MLIQSLQSLAISPALFRSSTRPALTAGARWLSSPNVAPNALRLASSGTINSTLHPLWRRVRNSPLRGRAKLFASASFGPIVGASTRAALQPREIGVGRGANSSVDVPMTIDRYRGEDARQRATRSDSDSQRNTRRSTPHAQRSVPGFDADAFVRATWPFLLWKPAMVARHELRFAYNGTDLLRPFADLGADRLRRPLAGVHLLKLAGQERQVWRRTG